MDGQIMNFQNVNLNIASNPDELTLEEAIMTYRDIQSGYHYSVPNVSLKTKEYNGFIGKLKEMFDFVEYDMSKSKNNHYTKFVSNQCVVYVSGNSSDKFVGFYTREEVCLKEVWDVYKHFREVKQDVQAYTHSFAMVKGVLDENTSMIEYDKIEYINEDYYPYIDTRAMFNQFFTGDENILLLTGEPGLGKSKLSTLAIKHAFENTHILPYDKMAENENLDEQFISIAFVKSVDVLADDSFWRKMEQLTPDFCIIDDLDYMLTKRDSEVNSREDAVKNAFLNQFLSFTDGVEKYKTKFIITTNQSFDDVDSALLRKGRLFDILELRKLDKEEALKIWLSNELTSEEFFNVFTEHEVLQAELGSEISKRLNKRIESSTEPYLKEQGISMIQKATRKKQISL